VRFEDDFGLLDCATAGRCAKLEISPIDDLRVTRVDIKGDARIRRMIAKGIGEASELSCRESRRHDEHRHNQNDEAENRPADFFQRIIRQHFRGRHLRGDLLSAVDRKRREAM
jgi:hypothetical protein